jgi:hypothetical protein
MNQSRDWRRGLDFGLNLFGRSFVWSFVRSFVRLVD